MSLVLFAENELNRLLKDCDDSESLNMQKTINNDILDMVKMFSNQHHSGFSAKYSLNLLNRLLNYKPVSAITDNDDEWEAIDYGGDVAYQCKRCPSIFKSKDGKVYNVEGKIFSDDNGHTWYTSSESRVYIDLPYNVPTSPECVILDTKQERDNILTSILNIIAKLNGNDDNHTDVNEDCYLIDLLEANKFDELKQNLIDMYSIKKPLYDFDESDKPRLWEIVSYVTTAECENIEKAK